MRKRRRFVLALLIIFGPAILAILFLHVTRDLRAEREKVLRESKPAAHGVASPEAERPGPRGTNDEAP